MPAKASQTAALEALLWQALASPIGLLIRTPTPKELRQRLYQLRVKSKDEALAVLQIDASPFPEGDLIIIKVQREPRLDGPTLPLDQLDL